MLNILSRSIDNIMSDLGWSCIIIHGQPVKQFVTLMHKYECHYVCPHEWCDDIADLNTFGPFGVHHYSTVGESHSKYVARSIALTMSDDGYKTIPGGALTVYLPSSGVTTISRNEFNMYLAIGVGEDVIRPYNSVSIEFNSTRLAHILSLVHIELPRMPLLYHPSIGAYIGTM